MRPVRWIKAEAAQCGRLNVGDFAGFVWHILDTHELGNILDTY
jgi:hypothetical protein